MEKSFENGKVLHVMCGFDPTKDFSFSSRYEKQLNIPEQSMLFLIERKYGMGWRCLSTVGVVFVTEFYLKIYCRDV